MEYDGRPYPGKISDSDSTTVLVKVLHPIGDNKFITPARGDELWYMRDQIVLFIPEPKKPSPRARFFAVDSQSWDAIRDHDV